MPQALAFVFPAVFAAGGSMALITAAGGLTLAGVGASIAGALLLNVAAGAMAKRAEVKPENVQLNVRQATGARVKHYGRVKAGGTIVFFRATEGKFYRVVVHGHGEFDAIEAVYLDKAPVSLDVDGFVTEAQYQNGGRPRVQILSRRGEDLSSAYAEIGEVWPVWTAAHRLDGLCTTLTIAEQVEPESFRAVYPNGEPGIELLLRGTRVLDPRTGLISWSDNAAAVIGDYITSPDGFNRPGRMHAASFIAAASDSDDVIPLAAGGSEPRYRIWGSYALTEKPQEVLRAMLSACAGEISLRPDGKIGLRVGKARTPVVTLTSADVIELTEFSLGPDLLDRYNELPFTYTDPTLEYTTVSGDPWVNADRVEADGETLVGPMLDLGFAPSHSQGRRVAKIQTERANPAISYVIRCHPRAMVALYEELITLDIPEIAAAGTFRVLAYSLGLGDGSVTYTLAQYDTAATDWTTAQEGQAQVMPPAPPQSIVPAISGVTVEPGPPTYRGNGEEPMPSFQITWAPTGTDLLRVVVKYKLSSASAWVQSSAALPPSAVGYVLPYLYLGQVYDIRVCLVNGNGTEGPPTMISGVTAGVTTTAPPALAGFSAAVLGGSVDLSWSPPNSPLYAGARIYRAAGASAVFADAALIFTGWGVTITHVDPTLAPGDYRYWAAPINGTGKEGPLSGPVALTIL